MPDPRRALKGHHSLFDALAIGFRPFRASGLYGWLQPGAPPWAGESGPFRAGIGLRPFASGMRGVNQDAW